MPSSRRLVSCGSGFPRRPKGPLIKYVCSWGPPGEARAAYRPRYRIPSLRYSRGGQANHAHFIQPPSRTAAIKPCISCS